MFGGYVQRDVTLLSLWAEVVVIITLIPRMFRSPKTMYKWTSTGIHWQYELQLLFASWTQHVPDQNTACKCVTTHKHVLVPSMTRFADHSLCFHADSSYDLKHFQCSITIFKIFGCPMPSIDPIDDVVQKTGSNAWDIRIREQKSIDFALEGHTSMSPRSNEKHAFFEKWRTYDAFCKVFRPERS